MKKTPKIDMYDPQIYPRRLYVAVEVEDLHKYFRILSTDSKVEFTDDEAREDFQKKDYAMVTRSVINKEDGKYGVLIQVPDLDEMTQSDISHEAVHAADYMYQELGMYTEDFKDGNEGYAYLVGWIAGCVSKSVIKAKQNLT
jgi:hypothetical protein